MVTSPVLISVASFRKRVRGSTLQLTIRLLLKKILQILGFFKPFFYLNIGIAWAYIVFNVAHFCGDLLTSVEQNLW